MTHIAHPGLVKSFTLNMNADHYVRFYIWRSKEAMQAACPPGNGDYLGRCIGSVWVLRDEKYIGPRRFGEVHLVIGDHGVGIVAHEIQHLMNYWINFTDWDLEENDEDIAWLCGEIHRAFWNEYYASSEWMELNESSAD